MISSAETTSSSVSDLASKFGKLLLNASGDTETLNKFHDMLSEELERVSNSSGISINGNEGHGSEKPTNQDDVQQLSCLVNHIPEFITSELLRDSNIMNEIQSIYESQHFNQKYVWMSVSDDHLQWGGRSYKPLVLSDWAGISHLMQKIKTEYNFDWNSCLLVRYSPDDHGVGLHQDKEAIIDNSHPMVITSLGSTRTLEFWDSKSESTGTLVKQIVPKEGDLVIMNVGCQEMLWHRVLSDHQPYGNTDGYRYALTFRKTLQNSKSHTALRTSSPILGDLTMLPNGFLVHANRANKISDKDVPQDVVQPSVPSAPPASPPPNNSSFPIVPPSAPPPPNNTPPASVQPSAPPLPNNPPKHLIIGDSLVKCLEVPGSVSICKGGIYPADVLSLLPGSTDIIHPNDYHRLKTVTVVVGTNALNVTRPGKEMALLDVVEDYERLIHNLRTFFPNAKIGLYNVIPREYTCTATRDRIIMFNTIFEQHVVPRLKRVFWIHQFREFLDNRGMLREDLYGRLGIHLKPKGKAMMAKCIRGFQRSMF